MTVPLGGAPGSTPPSRHGRWAVLTLVTLAIAASCWSVAELSGAWSRTVPVVSSGAQPPAIDPVPANPPDAPAGPPGLAALPGDNPLFALGRPLSGNRCLLPSYSDREPLGFFTSAVACLDRDWAPVLAAAESPTTPVRLRMSPVAGNPCGGEPTSELARYCEGTIYLTPRTGLGSDRSPAAYLEAIAHEYGRHLQQLSGVASTASRLRDTVRGDQAGGLVLARRQELQASCLAGMAIADLVTHKSLSGPLRDQIAKAASARGDSARHPAQSRHRGSTESNRYWFAVGYRSTSPRSCNTWLASPAQVH